MARWANEVEYITVALCVSVTYAISVWWMSQWLLGKPANAARLCDIYIPKPYHHLQWVAHTKQIKSHIGYKCQL